VAFFSTWFVIGVCLDGWAHTHRLPDSFFTPWHAVIYSGVLGAALVLAGTSFAAWRHDAPWRHALPAGYGLSLLGAGLFLITGVADFVWHSLFGIEADLEALYSPPHLLLAGAGAFDRQRPAPRSLVSTPGEPGDPLARHPLADPAGDLQLLHQRVASV
jgi:hypothetical protein